MTQKPICHLTDAVENLSYAFLIQFVIGLEQGKKNVIVPVLLCNGGICHREQGHGRERHGVGSKFMNHSESISVAYCNREKPNMFTSLQSRSSCNLESMKCLLCQILCADAYQNQQTQEADARSLPIKFESTTSKIVWFSVKHCSILQKDKLLACGRKAF